MQIATERMILTTWESDDWIALRPVATDIEVMRYITGGIPWTDEQVQSFVERQIETFSSLGFCRWKLLNKADGSFMGFCGAGLWRTESIPEIGWWLARDRWGLGFATEAARAALNDVFERVKLDRVVSIAMPENKASRHVMDKIGLRFDSEFDNSNQHFVKYGMTREQFGDRHVR